MPFFSFSYFLSPLVCFIRIMLASFLFVPLTRLCIIRLHKQCRIAERAFCLLTLVYNQSRVCSLSAGHIFIFFYQLDDDVVLVHQCWGGIIAFDFLFLHFLARPIVCVYRMMERSDGQLANNIACQADRQGLIRST